MPRRSKRRAAAKRERAAWGRSSREIATKKSKPNTSRPKVILVTGKHDVYKDARRLAGAIFEKYGKSVLIVDGDPGAHLESKLLDRVQTLWCGKRHYTTSEKLLGDLFPKWACTCTIESRDGQELEQHNLYDFAGAINSYFTYRAIANEPHQEVQPVTCLKFSKFDLNSESKEINNQVTNPHDMKAFADAVSGGILAGVSKNMNKSPHGFKHIPAVNPNDTPGIYFCPGGGNLLSYVDSQCFGFAFMPKHNRRFYSKLGIVKEAIRKTADRYKCPYVVICGETRWSSSLSKMMYASADGLILTGNVDYEFLRYLRGVKKSLTRVQKAYTEQKDVLDGLKRTAGRMVYEGRNLNANPVKYLGVLLDRKSPTDPRLEEELFNEASRYILGQKGADEPAQRIGGILNPKESPDIGDVVEVVFNHLEL